MHYIFNFLLLRGTAADAPSRSSIYFEENKGVQLNLISIFPRSSYVMTPVHARILCNDGDDDDDDKCDTSNNTGNWKHLKFIH